MCNLTENIPVFVHNALTGVKIDFYMKVSHRHYYRFVSQVLSNSIEMKFTAVLNLNAEKSLHNIEQILMIHYIASGFKKSSV